MLATVVGFKPLGRVPLMEPEGFLIWILAPLQSLIACLYSFSTDTQNNANFIRDRERLKIVPSQKEEEALICSRCLDTVGSILTV